MKPRQLIIYLVVFLLLGGFYLWYDVYFKAKETKFKNEQAKLFDLDYDQVTAFKIVNNKSELQLARRGKNDWRITKPVETPAMEWMARSVVDRFLETKKERAFEAPLAKMAEFGLDKPAQSLTFMSGSKKLAPTLYVGAKSPLGDYYYARLGKSKEVFTIEGYLQKTLDKTLYELRKKDLVLYDRDKIDGLRFLAPDQGELKKSKTGEWMIVKPNLGLADDAKVEKLFRLGLKGDIEKFITDQDGNEKYGLDKPQVKMQVLSGDKVVAELAVGRASKKAAKGSKKAKEETIEGYWARSSERPEVLLISQDAFSVLKQKLADFKDKHLVKFESWDVGSVEISSPKQKFKAKKVEGRWRITEPKEHKSQGSQIETFLTDIEDLEYVQTFKLNDETIKKYDLDKPGLDIRLSDTKKMLAELRLSLRPAGGNLVAVKVDNSSIALIKADFLEKLPPEFKKIAADFKSAKTAKKNQGK